MPRNPLGALLFYPIGLALAGGGAIAAGWVALAVYDMQQAYDAALWALGRSPIRFDSPTEAMARGLIQPGARVWQAAVAAFMVFVGWDMLRGARTALRPTATSDDGKFEIELKAPQPRLGEKLEGRLLITNAPGAQEMFRVELVCTCLSTDPGGKKRHRVVFAAQQDVAATEDPSGWYVPFSFDVPADAPASRAWTWINPGVDVFQWQLKVYRAAALITAGSWFDLQVAAPAASPVARDGGWRGLLPRPLAIALGPGPMNSARVFLLLVLVVFVVLPIVSLLLKSVASLF